MMRTASSLAAGASLLCWDGDAGHLPPGLILDHDAVVDVGTGQVVDEMGACAVTEKGAVLEGDGKRPARWRRDLRSEGLKNQFHIVGDARECRTNRSVLLETK